MMGAMLRPTLVFLAFSAAACTDPPAKKPSATEPSSDTRSAEATAAESTSRPSSAAPAVSASTSAWVAPPLDKPPTGESFGAKVDRTVQCSALIDTINGGEKVMDQEAKLDDPKAVEAHAKALDTFAKAIGDVAVKDVLLSKRQAEFKANIVELATFLRELATGTIDFAKVTIRAEQIDTQRNWLVETINAYCART